MHPFEVILNYICKCFNSIQYRDSNNPYPYRIVQRIPWISLFHFVVPASDLPQRPYSYPDRNVRPSLSMALVRVQAPDLPQHPMNDAEKFSIYNLLSPLVYHLSFRSRGIWQFEYVCLCAARCRSNYLYRLYY